jgi:hypothetical protein
LVTGKPAVLPESDLEDELRNDCVKITLLKEIKDVPIYEKTIRDLCIKKLGRKQKDPLTIQVVGRLAEMMIGKASVEKYFDPGNLVVTIVGCGA